MATLTNSFFFAFFFTFFFFLMATNNTSTTASSSSNADSATPRVTRSSSLTEEQRSRMEANKQAALKRLEATKKRKQQEETAQGKNDKKKARWTTFYEYDLSTFENTKGGFIIDEAAAEKINQFKDKTTKIDPDYCKMEGKATGLLPQRLLSLEPEEVPKCRDCGSTDVDPIFVQVFHIPVCYTCKDNCPERYSLITKTEAKEDYLLTDPELKDPELLPHWSKPNPRKSTWNNMMLYVREMVEAYAFKKWDGPEGLDAEYERRESQKKDKKDKKFKDKLADMRRRTMTSQWERKRQQGPHKHDFGDTFEDDEGTTYQECRTCGLQVESEEF
ncbi:XPA protein C-terminus-domain-containing protein [Gongronella butleri]|nr:XPA protein C-terminus-domain-containing protein [Gongronella butleri]